MTIQVRPEIKTEKKKSVPRFFYAQTFVQFCITYYVSSVMRILVHIITGSYKK